MRILEITNYSAGICGVFARVKQESVLLSERGNEVIIFSSNRVKGSDNDIADRDDKIGNVKIRRFHAKKLGGESFMRWNFESEALRFKPDVIIAHSYRHPHTLKALKVGKKLNIPVFLVTHAPFDRTESRSRASKIMVSLYDIFIGRRTLKKFRKVIAITKWEIPFLKKLGVRSDRIEYIPNGIGDEFFDLKGKKKKEENKILFLGRVSPIKDVETLIKAVRLIKDKSIKFEILGPREKEYYSKLLSLIEFEGVGNRIVFSDAIYDVRKRIEKIDSCKLFVLPSKSEGMPQSLIEAMARGKIVVASDNRGSSELIDNGKNGYLFKVGNEKELAEKIDLGLSDKNAKIRKEAVKSVEKFRWNKIITSIEKIIFSKSF